MEKKLNNDLNNHNTYLQVEVVYLAGNSDTAGNSGNLGTSGSSGISEGSETSFIVILDLPAGSTIQDALLQANILSTFPELGRDIQDLAKRVGIFGEVKELKTLLQAGDRIEIYRDLKIDPKLARKKRANQERIRKIKLQQATKKDQQNKKL